jgi:hypothetical protein
MGDEQFCWGKATACSSQGRGMERPRKNRKEGARGEISLLLVRCAREAAMGGPRCMERLAAMEGGGRQST